MRFSFSRAKFPKAANIILAFVSVILLTLSFPDFDLWIIAWFALVPLFYALEREKESLVKSAFLGWIFGTGFFFGACWWLTFAMTTYGGIPSFVAYILLFVIVAIVGLYSAVFAGLLSILLKRFGGYAIFAAPFLWTALEFARYHITFNNWNEIAYSQAFNLSENLIKLGSIGGIYLVGFCILLVNSLLNFVVSLFQKFSKIKESRRQTLGSILLLYFIPYIGVLASKKKKIYKIGKRWKPGNKVRGWYVSLTIVTLATSILFGIISVIVSNNNNSASYSANDPKAINVVAIQANVPMSGLNYDKWLALRMRHAQLAEEGLAKLKLQQPDYAEKPLLVIFPESPMNFMYAEDAEFRAFITDFALKHNAYILFNSAEPNSAKGNYFNSAILVNPAGRKIGQYDKIFLVPFGEYAPVPEAAQKIVPTLVGNFELGKQYNLFDIGDVKAGTMICYESHFPTLSREFVRRGADVLIEMTNDGYLGDTGVLKQHLASAVFRAIETNRPVLRTTNVGITAYINERGEVLEASKSYTEDTRIWTMRKSDGSETFYVKYGDWFAWLSIIVSLGLLILSFNKRNTTRI